MAAVPSIGRAARVEGGLAPEADLTRALYEQYANQIFRYCLHQLGSREEAEDAVQSTFLNAFRGIKRGVVPELESAWLFKIAHNVCLSRRRTSWRRGRIESPTDFDVVEELAPAPSRRADELIGLQDVLEQLPENQRRAILLREWQGLSYREISEELDLSQSAVETLIFRARRALASGLEQPPATKRRIIRSADLGNILAGIKSLLLGGGAAVKVAATVAVVSASTVVAAAPVQQHRAHHHAVPTKPAAPARSPSNTSPARSSSTATIAAAEPASVAKGKARRIRRTRHETAAAFGSAQLTSSAAPTIAVGEVPAVPVAETPPAASEPVSTPAPVAAAAQEPPPAPAASPPTSAADSKTADKTDTKKSTATGQGTTTQTGQAGSSGTGSTQGSSDSPQRTNSSTTTPVVSAPTADTTPVIQTKTTTSIQTPSTPTQTTTTTRVLTPVVAPPAVIVSAPAPTPAPSPVPPSKTETKATPVPAPVVAAPVTTTQPVVSSPTLSLSSGSTSIGKVPVWTAAGSN